jgi:capsule polysaccharide modification protein KpsS
LPADYAIFFLKNLALRAICRCGLSDLFFAVFFNERISHQLYTHYFALQLFYFKYSTAFSLKSTYIIWLSMVIPSFKQLKQSKIIIVHLNYTHDQSVYSHCGQSVMFFSNIIILHQCGLYGAAGYPQEITVDD